MTAIGPGLAPSIAAAQTGAPPGARAAQAAFFRTAMAAAQTIQPVAPVAAPTAQTPTIAVDETGAARPSRPGALLDIRA
ncbi:MAG TPA: hypothetical protein VGR32_11620 [Brevundimonas sp.]|jgi:hypothetical protein|uniref:hypothetical protein n=1 Tax=Brevundimonas sp. TaxID=1871086 RepID=UPI002DE3F2BD|nr:hypothetical protein [Brevundimonas sp.]